MMMHKRLSIPVSLLLVACSQTASPSTLSPEQVLKNSVKAVKTLESAQYALEMDFDVNGQGFLASGTANMDGSLADAGQQLQFLVDFSADVKDTQSVSALNGSLEVIALSESEVYVNLQNISAKPQSAVFRPEIVEALTGTWWSLAQGPTSPVAEAVSPDPRLLRAQAEIVSVTRDRGIRTLKGRDTYHYDVELDKQKLLDYLKTVAQEQGNTFDSDAVKQSVEDISASGQLWIDAQDFYVQKLMWVVQSVPLRDGGTASLSFMVTFDNHNNAPDIVPPTDPKTFSPSMLFALPADAQFPAELQRDLPPEFDEAMINDILLNMNSQ